MKGLKRTLLSDVTEREQCSPCPKLVKAKVASFNIP